MKRNYRRKNINLYNNLESIVESARKYNNLHISLDIDAIDPIYTPSTGTPVKNGLELNEVINFLKLF